MTLMQKLGGPPGSYAVLPVAIKSNALWGGLCMPNR